MIRTYRPRPWAVEAVQYTAETCREICEWASVSSQGAEHVEGICGVWELAIPTGSGEVIDAEPGDWVVKTHDEFRVMDTDTFAATYEEAT